MNKLAIWKSVLEDQEDHIEELEFRNPAAIIMYRMLLTACVVALFVSFIIWGIDIHARNAYDAGQRDLYAAMDLEHEQMMAAAEEAERIAAQEEESLQIREAQAIARALFGIRNFTAKYGYTNDDLETYARCVTNRCEATGKSVEEVLAQPQQFIAYSDKNDLVGEYYDLALRFVADWHTGSLKPCDTRFQYAVLKDTGIWLVDDPGKDVPERWHA